MNYAAIKKTDIANGPGVRVSLFVSGCTHACKGCFNEEAWDFQYGGPFREEAQEEVLRALEPSYIAGITFLGGEPLDLRNRRGVARMMELARRRYPQKTIWCYTGYVFEPDVRVWLDQGDGDIRKIVSLTDVLVDGPYVEEKKNLNLAFRGSENQRLIDVRRSLEAGKTVEWSAPNPGQA